ncbi:MAG TPA: NDP-sugar synthase [Actinomycetota bacterium]
MRPEPRPRDVTAVVFAAGLGTRLLPMTAAVPKALVTILDVPLVDLAVAAVSTVTSRIVVNAGHLAGSLTGHLQGAQVDVFVEEPAPYGNAATLRAVLDRAGGTVITYNCDLVSDLDVGLLLDAHRRGGRVATLACKPVNAGADFVADGDSLRLIHRRSRSVAGQLFLGAACFEREALTAIPRDRPLGLLEGLIEPLLTSDAIHVYEHDGYAKDAGTFRSLLEISRDALDGAIAIPFPGDVVTTPLGRGYVGPGARVAHESIGRDAVVGAGAFVHPEARIASSLVWSDENVPEVELRNCIFFRGAVISVDMPP